MYEKSSRLSVAYREKGNESYKNEDFFKALVFYNKALAFAETNEDLSFAYGNRSAVFMEIKKYTECLQNIEWARENGYLKLEKLKEREEKCKNMMQADTKEVPESFFKLSYPANPKIPFIVENLYMKETPKYGRGIYAATDLKAGDVIAIEKPIFAALKDLNDSRYKHCCFCLSSNMMNLIPCLKSSAVMFCSEECRNGVYNCFLFDCSPAEMFIPANREIISADLSLSFFSKFFNDSDEFHILSMWFNSDHFKKTVFDYDLSNSVDYKMNLLSCFLALKSKNKNRSESLPQHFAGIGDYNRIDVFYREQNQLQLHHHSTSILTFGSLINHACNPNVDRVAIDNKVAFVVQKPIKADEQLFMTYNTTFFTQQNASLRRQGLKQEYDFICGCDACINNKDYLKILKSNASDSPRNRPFPESYEEALKELKENWAYIEDHADNVGIFANYYGRNIKLMHVLATFETFPHKI